MAPALVEATKCEPPTAAAAIIIPGPRDLIKLDRGAEVFVVVVLTVLSIMVPLMLACYFPLPYQYHVL
jgi:hypothetical protein